MLETELNYLVYNIVNENHYKHCRLCLNEIEENYIKFDDSLIIDSESGNSESLSELLTKLFGEEICNEVAGIDAVCTTCADDVLQTAKFLHKCDNSTKLLHKVLDNLVGTLNVDVNTLVGGESLYIVVKEEESKLILVKDEKEKKMQLPIINNIQCLQCNEVFHTMENYKNHNMDVHGILSCHKCLETLQNEEDLRNHEASDVVFQCNECHEFRCTENSLKQHHKKIHQMFICKECGKSFKTYDKLQSHEQKHQIKYKCPKCGKTYTTKEFFLRHRKQCLEGTLDPHPMRSSLKKTHFCEKCDKGYSTSGGLRVHNRFVHGDAKPHICPHCNKQFTAPSYLKVHMVKHTGEKNFECEICFRKFVSKEALIYHIRRHTGERPFSCHICEERFVNSSARAEHIKFKHIGPTLMCEICSRKFVTPTFLRLHMKKHHDPSNKLFAGRCLATPNVPGKNNITVKITK
ncbi:hypothetical protein O3G_MSEX010642 [Manduca sexta]|uniref:Uncharacterized protein n=2 Tax=Manduca sexta TaxID=7130 RepID=A0A922CU65_MANSE|nr:hypothetical protein O3G_MSEX010642 [Manduca sexta]